jgi:putative hemolysin
MKSDFKEIIASQIDFGNSKFSLLMKKVVLRTITRILYLNRVEKFLQTNSHLEEKQFINQLFDDLNFSYLISSRDLLKIPAQGRLICVANHPIGSLDALSLLKAFLEVRRDVKIVANEVLYSIEPLRGLLIPVKLDSTAAQKNSIVAIQQALQSECAVIIFPAATVSRLSGLTIVDSKWHKGSIRFASRFNSSILPVHIEARNSIFFYVLSVVSKKFSTLLLVHELFNKKNQSITIRIGDVIPAKAFSSPIIDNDYQTKLLKKHVYQIGKGKKGIYTTEINIIHPIDRKLLKTELNNSQFLGVTRDNMKIYLTTRSESPNTINEIARLRELTFRKVGEGTGKNHDLDKFDHYYSHLVLWDDTELEIIGSYRIGNGNQIMSTLGQEGFYTSTLFKYSPDFKEKYLSNSIELGRSFVQNRYWKTNALTYLWQGIGTYLQSDPTIKYMFGGVSISNAYPPAAKEMIVYYFNKWFEDKEELAESKRQYNVSERQSIKYQNIFNSGTAKDDYKILKKMLKPYGFTIPVLYKHYSDLCDTGGVRFLDFGTDPDFENCIDGLILVEVDLIKEEKKQKFLGTHLLKATA